MIFNCFIWVVDSFLLCGMWEKSEQVSHFDGIDEAKINKSDEDKNAKIDFRQYLTG